MNNQNQKKPQTRQVNTSDLEKRTIRNPVPRKVIPAPPKPPAPVEPKK